MERRFTRELAYQAGIEAAQTDSRLSKGVAAAWIGCSPGHLAASGKDLFAAFEQGYRLIKPDDERASPGSPKGQPKPRRTYESLTRMDSVFLVDCPGPCTQQHPEGSMVADSNLPQALCPECYELYQHRVAMDEQWKLEVRQCNAQSV
jgi:hypothetical protein